jgi:hypothetical protein
MEAAAAARTVMALHIESHLLPRQMSGKCQTPGRGSRLGVLIARRRWRLVSFGSSDVGLKVLETKGQLIGIEALGAASELPSLKLFDEALETFDLVVAALDDGCHIAHQAVQKVDVGGQVLEIESHERV